MTMDGDQIHREIDEYLRQVRGANDQSDETLEGDATGGTPLFGRRGTLVEAAEEIAVEGCGVIPTGERGILVRVHSHDADDFPETVVVRFECMETPVVVRGDTLVEPYPRGREESVKEAITGIADVATLLDTLEDAAFAPLIHTLHGIREQLEFELEGDPAEELVA